jgi:hypothetical protein
MTRARNVWEHFTPARRYGRRGDPLEKAVQAQIVACLHGVGASVWTLGTTRRKGDHPGTMQSAGLPDVMAFVPLTRAGCGAALPHSNPDVPFMALLLVEIKRGGNAMSTSQQNFAWCAQQVGPPVHHVAGGLNEVLAWLVAMGRAKASV